MENDFSFLSCTMLEDQDIYSTLLINQELNDDCLPLKRNYAAYTDYDALSLDDSQSTASKSPRAKKLGRKLAIDEREDQEKIRRKEQNRAAQRAFRERKEKHVKELEKRFKQFQDKHALAIQQLIHENQYLRSVICRLEVENCVLKGTPVNSMEDVSKALENARTALPLPPPPSTSSFQLSFKPPLPPLQIRPSSMEQQQQQQQQQVNKLAKMEADHQEKTQRDFTFSISTPDTLRAHAQINRRDQHFPAVQLYPDHSHPVHLMRKDRLKKQKESQKIQKEPVNNNDQELDAFLKPFLETHDDINIHGTISRTATQTVPERKSNRRRQQTSSKIWQRVSQHASNPKFSVDQLLNAVKKSTLLTNERLVLDEWDMEQMLQDF